MILRSGKRLKHSFAESDDEGEDIISNLPNALLIQILCLLPEADATRTRFLSKRWKDLCVFLPNLHIVVPYCLSIAKINKFHDAVHQTLALRDGMPIQRFSLNCSNNFYYNRVLDWLHTVVQCKVEEVELIIPLYRYNEVRFRSDLFKTCNTLVRLTLKGRFILDLREADLLLPCLKKMNLVSIVYMGDQSFANLVSGCPSLEELFVEICISGRNGNLQAFNVSSLSLKRLSILVKECSIGNNKVMIDAPNLQYLYIEDRLYTKFILMNQLPNVEAHINAVSETVIQLVASLSSAKKLTFTYSTMTNLHFFPWPNMPMFPNLVELFPWPNMPMFPNLVELVVGIQCIRDSNLLLRFLLNVPNVEHITFLDLSIRLHGIKRWYLPLEAPACLRFKVKKITIHNREAVTPEDFIVIRYWLEHSTNLETLTINADKLDPKMHEQLLSIHRGSNMCRIEFV